jgi:hypothetical protein
MPILISSGGNVEPLTIARVVLFVRSPNHWLPLLGALIVFLTFVVKEGLHDSWKATADAITAAQYAYAIRIDNIAIQEELRDNSKNLTLFVGQQQPGGPDRFAQAKSVLNDCSNILRSTGQVASTTELLLSVLPENDPLKKRYNDFAAEVGKVDQLLSDLGVEETRVELDANLVNLPSTPGQENDPKKRSEQVEAARDAFINKVSRLNYFEFENYENRGNLLLADLIDRCEAIRSRDERDAGYAWWISAFLFALGWSLGVLGKMYGVPDAGAGE